MKDGLELDAYAGYEHVSWWLILLEESSGTVDTCNSGFVGHPKTVHYYK